MTDPIQIINQHIPSLSDTNEVQIWDTMRSMLTWPEESEADTADLAIRTCSCGRHIDGFYDYTDHLKDEMENASCPTTAPTP